MRVGSLAVTLLAVCAILFSLYAFMRFSSGNLLSDFRGFYCAAGLERQGIDSYRQEPLYRCEAQSTLPAMWRASGNVTDPAPLPPYALAVFVPLSLLPYAGAAALWSVLLLCAWLLVAVCMRRLAGVSWTVAVCSLVFAAMMSVSLGQIAPLAIAAVVVAALLLELRRYAFAGAVAAIAMIEPHVALPVCVAMFFAFTRVRASMLLTGAAMLAISAAFGVARNAEYLGAVLPAHALSDVADVGQFSATVLAHAAGFADRVAMHIGTLWYALSCIAGIATAFGLRKTTGRDAMVALIPMAFAVFGGAYVHWQQVVAAIPALMVIANSGRVRSSLYAAALVGLAIPWLYVVGWGFLIPGAVAIAALLVYDIVRPPMLVESAVVAGVFVVLLLCNHGLAHGAAQPQFVATTAPNDWADNSWGAYVRARIPIGNAMFLWLHVPTWLALSATLSMTVSAARASKSLTAPAL
jgi:hypothetical protein